VGQAVLNTTSIIEKGLYEGIVSVVRIPLHAFAIAIRVAVNVCAGVGQSL
jgi:hypothetical protein